MSSVPPPLIRVADWLFHVLSHGVHQVSKLRGVEDVQEVTERHNKSPALVFRSHSQLSSRVLLGFAHRLVRLGLVLERDEQVSFSNPDGRRETGMVVDELVAGRLKGGGNLCASNVTMGVGPTLGGVTPCVGQLHLLHTPKVLVEVVDDGQTVSVESQLEAVDVLPVEHDKEVEPGAHVHVVLAPLVVSVLEQHHKVPVVVPVVSPESLNVLFLLIEHGGRLSGHS